MSKSIKPNNTEIHEFQKENLRGVLLNLNFKNGEGLPVPITKPDEINVKMTLQRANRESIEMFDLNLTQIIAAFVSQTKALRVVTSDYTFAAINRLPIEFAPILLSGTDKLIVETTIRTSAAPTSTINESELSIESLTGLGDSGFVPQVKLQNFATGDTRKEFKEFARNTLKVVLITDSTKFNHENDNTAESVAIQSDHVNVNLTDTIISYENDLRNEGENRSFHEVLYWDNSPLVNARMIVKLKGGATSVTRMLSVSVVKA